MPAFRARAREANLVGRIELTLVSLHRVAGSVDHSGADQPTLLANDYLIVEAQLVRHLAGADFQLIVGQAHRAQERVPARIIVKIR